MSRLILYIILFYLLYKFITNFLIPVGKASAQVRRSVQQMQEEQQRFAARQQYQQQQQEQQSQQTAGHRTAQGDYIDFEEIK